MFFILFLISLITSLKSMWPKTIGEVADVESAQNWLYFSGQEPYHSIGGASQNHHENDLLTIFVQLFRFKIERGAVN